jgi:hypothetical protein
MLIASANRTVRQHKLERFVQLESRNRLWMDAFQKPIGGNFMADAARLRLRKYGSAYCRELKADSNII